MFDAARSTEDNLDLYRRTCEQLFELLLADVAPDKEAELRAAIAAHKTACSRFGEIAQACVPGN